MQKITLQNFRRKVPDLKIVLSAQAVAVTLALMLDVTRCQQVLRPDIVWDSQQSSVQQFNNKQRVEVNQAGP